MQELTDQDVLDAVENGHRSNREIADACGISVGHAQRVTKDMHERGVLDRKKEGRANHYYAAEPQDEPQQVDAHEPDPQQAQAAQNGQHPPQAQQYATPPQAAQQPYQQPPQPYNPYAAYPPQPPHAAQQPAQQPQGPQFDPTELADTIARAVAEATTQPVGVGATEIDDPTEETIWPVNRNYDWNDYLLDPDEVSEYIESDDEYENVKLHARADNLAYRTTLYGPTGCGKTELVRYLAVDEQMPIFQIQAKFGLRESDLLGKGSIAGAGRGTVWSDGVLTKALLASLDPEVAEERYGVPGWDGKVVLFIDEINRARPEEKGALFSILDQRCQVELHGGRGGEIIKGNRENIVVISTANEGHGHKVQTQDVAERGRFGGIKLTWLGYANPDTANQAEIDEKRDVEAGVIADRTAIPLDLAREMVTVANTIRKKSNDSDDPISYGLPTRALIKWAESARERGEGGISNPVMKAAYEFVIEPYYGQPNQTKARQEVITVIQPRLDNAPVDPDEYDEFAAVEHVECSVCDFKLSAKKADERSLYAGSGCPDCGKELLGTTKQDAEAMFGGN